MKPKQLLHLLLLFVASQLLFACGTARYYDFGAGHNSAYHKEKKAQSAQEAAMAENTVTSVEITDLASENTNVVPALEASAGAVILETPARKMYSTKQGQVSSSNTPGSQVAEAPDTDKLQIKAEKAKQKKGWFVGIKAVKATFLEVIFAILIPPVGVAIHEGITTRFWISLVLTLLFWLPGAIYALLVVTDSI